MIGLNISGSKLDKEYPTRNFKSNKDSVKMLLFYFIELAMMRRERIKATHGIDHVGPHR